MQRYLHPFKSYCHFYSVHTHGRTDRRQNFLPHYPKLLYFIHVKQNSYPQFFLPFPSRSEGTRFARSLTLFGRINDAVQIYIIKYFQVLLKICANVTFQYDKLAPDRRQSCHAKVMVTLTLLYLYCITCSVQPARYGWWGGGEGGREGGEGA